MSKMTRVDQEVLARIIDDFRLVALPCLADLAVLAKKWGVNSIEEREIESDAMLLPSKNGYSIVLKKSERLGLSARQRFSLAHELGHLLLLKSQAPAASGVVGTASKHRGHGYSDEEERLCDQIAAEILMPQMAFQEDGWMEGWSLRNLKTLADKYDTSIPATAIRMIDLMPEETLMGTWKISSVDGEKAELKRQHCGKTWYQIPGSSTVSAQRLQLINRAWNSTEVEPGFMPVKLGRRRPVDVPAEAMAWGRGEYKQVLVFYYPGREQQT